MATTKRKPPKKRPGKEEKKDKTTLAPAEQPIIITGGSVILEYPDDPNNRFDDDGTMPGRFKKFKNRSRGTDKVYLTHVDITEKDGSETVLLRIDLDVLGLHKKCKVKVYYST